jgi:mannosyltransferase
MACGVPVIAADVGAFSELVVEGLTGHVVPAGDAKALAAPLLALAGHEVTTQAAAAAARAHVEQHFALETEGDALIGIYRRLQASA